MRHETANSESDFAHTVPKVEPAQNKTAGAIARTCGYESKARTWKSVLRSELPRHLFEIPRRRGLGGLRLLVRINRNLRFGIGRDPHLDLGLQILGELDRDIVFFDPIELAGQIHIVGLYVEAL